MCLLTVQKMLLKSKRSDHAADRCWPTEQVKQEVTIWSHAKTSKNSPPKCFLGRNCLC